MGMDPVTIGAGVSTVGSLVGANQQKNAQKANQGAQSSIDNQLVAIYNAMLKNYGQVSDATDPAGSLRTAKDFYGQEAGGATPTAQFYRGEMTNGLDPSVRAAANANLATQEARGISAMRNQLGPSLPNLAGTIRDLNEQGLQAGVNQNIGLSAQDQGVRQQGAAGLQGVQSAGAGGLQSIADAVLAFGSSMLGGASQGFGRLGDQFGAAANQPQANPFTSIGQFLAQYGLGGAGATDTYTVGAQPAAAPSANLDPSILNAFYSGGFGLGIPPQAGGSLGQLPGLTASAPSAGPRP